MKTHTIFSKNNRLGLVYASLFCVSAAFAQNHEQVRVKVKKIVDGDTTVVEKTMNENEVEAFTKQFENDKGKNKQLMITIENVNNHRKYGSGMCFKAMMDSTMGHAFAFSDSSFDFDKRFNWNDSSMKNFAQDFKLNFDPQTFMQYFDFDIDSTEEGKIIIINKNNNHRISVIAEDNDDKNEVNDDNVRVKRKSIVIEDENGKPRKKVIVSTSVSVINMDDEKQSSTKEKGQKTEKESDFSFYPNPNNGDFVLELNMEGKSPAQINITDMTGKEVYSETISGTGKINKSINLNNKKGTFIVTIKQANKKTSKKIIIE